MFRSASCLALLLSIAPPLSAQEVLGTLEARQEDTFRTWFVTCEGAQTQSGWREMAPGLVDVSVWGHATADTATSVNEALILDFDVMTTTGTPVVIDPTLQYLSAGYAGGWLAVDASVLSVTLETFAVSEAGLSVGGTFTATLTYSTDVMKQILDPSRTQTMEGRFSAVLPPS